MPIQSNRLPFFIHKVDQFYELFFEGIFSIVEIMLNLKLQWEGNQECANILNG